MDLGLSEQQEMLRRVAREFLEAECPTSLVRDLEASERGYLPELWKRMAELGWLGLSFPSRYGGAGGELLDQVVLFEELGRAIVPGPMLASNVMAGQLLLHAGTEEQKADLLPRMARGDAIVTLAAPHASLNGGHTEIRAVAGGGGYVVDGDALFVPYAHVADYILCVAHTGKADGGGGVTLFLVDAGTAGLTTVPMESVANYKQHEVRFRDLRVDGRWVVGQEGTGSAPLAKASAWAIVVQCGEMVGRAEKVLDMVVEYSKVRVAFGRPIGSFQAVQHRCADLRVSVDGARVVTYRAAWKLAQGLPSGEEVAMAKACAGNVSRQAAVAGHSIFAGIAFTVEHDMQLYTMRSKISEASLGDTDFHLDKLAECMGL